MANDYYNHLSVHQDRPNATHFAEKCELDYRFRSNFRATFPDIKEVVIVRDLRDIYCSYRNYFHATSEEAIQIVTSYGKRMLVIKEYDSQASIFLRYEDCIRDPSLAARDLSDFLGIKIVDMGAKDGALFARHATSH